MFVFSKGVNFLVWVDKAFLFSFSFCHSLPPFPSFVVYFFLLPFCQDVFSFLFLSFGFPLVSFLRYSMVFFDGSEYLTGHVVIVALISFFVFLPLPASSQISSFFVTVALRPASDMFSDIHSLPPRDQFAFCPTSGIFSSPPLLFFR